ncbi:M20/M25/M40 family metallo-hydrolase [Sandaracinobacteroides hominis]|uniref:M20/M25/M40 family metallo-hydrolase n=1 Tax=Sandaracinobacteroides hominis TaxID=2780086 RepID=UPI0018F36C4A|nr:M20/M25/M40 family metallo-hydrolase [Sandaracinobacteroides hominis]
MRPLLLALALLSSAAHAGPNPAAEAQALELAKKAIAIRSVNVPGGRTADVAKLFQDALVAGGFAASDIEIVPVDNTAYMIARWPGSDPKLKPLVISGHIDVVEAKPSDWQRDPFTPVVENGYLFGRGASDMKSDAALAVATLIDLKRTGYKPKRTIILEFSGDEETTMKTSSIIAERLKDAELVLNVDGGGGRFSADNKPQYMTWQGAEKTYADFELTVTNPGGHSSAPSPENAIAQLSAALARIGAYRFKPELNDITRDSFVKAAGFERDAKTAAAMRAFAKNPADAQAIAVLQANPSYVGQIGTTCVPTMVNGGHALNALPQKATANINCRIFPGHSPASILAELEKVAAEPAVKFADVTEGSVPNDASPLRPDLVKAVENALGKAWPGVPVFASQSSGASDSMWFRYHKVPSYGVSPLFSKDNDSFAHGLNERVQLVNFAPAIVYYRSLFTELSK